MVFTRRQRLQTRGQGDAHDVTPVAASAVAESGAVDGLVTVSVVGSTAAITTIEFEPGAIADLNRVLEELAPRMGTYEHHFRWRDDNGSSHVRAALVGPSVTLPVTAGVIALGTWQQIMLIEFDTRSRQRELVVVVLGE